MKLDVVVVGASTAGLRAAALLARAGWHTAVFERQTTLDPARRTLIVTPAIQLGLRQLSPMVQLHQIETMALTSGRENSEIQFTRPDPIVERAAMIRCLSQDAQDAGASLMCGYRFEGFSARTGKVELSFKGSAGQIKATAARAVIGADGALSHVAIHAGINRPPVVPILQAEVALPGDWDPAKARVWFDRKQTRFFYWLIPESRSRGVLGLIGDQKSVMRPLLEDFLKAENLRAEAYQGAQVALHHPSLQPWGRVARIPVYLIGDAAGQVKVTTVGGTVTGFAGAEAAARAVANGTSYSSELKKLKRELDLHWWIRWALDRLDSKGYERLIQVLSRRVRKFLARYDRDSMASVFWRLPLIEPRLFEIGLRCLNARDRVPVPDVRNRLEEFRD